MLRDVDVSCTWTHGRCYAMLMCLALGHIVHTTQCLHLDTLSILRDVAMS